MDIFAEANWRFMFTGNQTIAIVQLIKSDTGEYLWSFYNEKKMSQVKPQFLINRTLSYGQADFIESDLDITLE